MSGHNYDSLISDLAWLVLHSQRLTEDKTAADYTDRVGFYLMARAAHRVTTRGTAFGLGHIRADLAELLYHTALLMERHTRAVYGDCEDGTSGSAALARVLSVVGTVRSIHRDVHGGTT